MLTREQVLKIAKLARLGITEAEVEKYQVQLSGIISYIDKLNEVNTDGVEPTSQVTGLLNCFRKDEVLSEPLANPDDLLANSRNNDQATHAILVPNVF